MKVKQNVRMVAFLGIILGATIMALVTFGLGQHVNASTVQTPSSNLVAMYVSYEGIDGEAIDPDGGKSSVVYGYSHMISNPYDLATGKVTTRQHTPLRVIKRMDKATPKLQEACTKGTFLPSVTLKLYFEADSGFKRFFSIELTNAQITSFQGYGSVMVNVQDWDFPKETVAFTYETVKWTYTEYDDAGNAKGNVEYEEDWISPPG